jgi:thioredoxin 1
MRYQAADKRYQAAGKWPVLIAAAVLVGIGTLVYSGLVTGGDARKTPKSKPLIGEQNMSIAHVNSQVQHADETNFGEIVLKSNVPVLVDFYADWCGPCNRLAPVLEELAAEVPDAKIVKINVDHSPRLAAEYGISSIPSLKVFRNGEVREELVGLASKSQLRDMLRR